MRISHSIIIILLTTFALISCKEEKQPEIISFEELAGYTEEDTSLQSSSAVVSVDLTLPFERFTLNQLALYDTFPQFKVHMLDRFGYESAVKRDFIGKNEVPYGKTSMVTPKASVYYYEFSDSVKTTSAFYNWLDCFGSDCNEVKLFEDIKSVKTPPMFTLVYDTLIVAVEYKCEHAKNDWNSFEKSIISEFGKDYNYCISVGCGGPLTWKK